MSFLVIAQEPYALSIAETVLGGEGDDALAAPELAPLPPSAVVSAWPDGTASIRRVAGTVLVNDQPLGDAAVPLAHGMRLVVGGVAMHYGERRARGSTALLTGVPDDELALLDDLTPHEPTDVTGGRLVAVEGGAVYMVPDEGLDIGRDPTCGVPLLSRDVSRVHARIAPELLGYVLTDRSANGSFVNGVRITDPRVLGNGDRIRVGQEEFRFLADPATFAPPPVDAAPAALAIGTPAARAIDANVARAVPAAPLFATLEVLNSRLPQGTRFRIERPVAHVGRGVHNDVQLAEDSISGAHATLTRRATGWVVLDLGSTNGTYVDGERVKGEQQIANGCELRFGNVKMVFRAMRGADRDEAATRAMLGVPADGAVG